MNKQAFLEELSKQTNIDIEICEKINKIFEENFFISKKNKDKIINEIFEKLNISLDDANNVYEKAKEILNKQIKNKITHPFGK